MPSRTWLLTACPSGFSKIPLGWNAPRRTRLEQEANSMKLSTMIYFWNTSVAPSALNAPLESDHALTGMATNFRPFGPSEPLPYRFQFRIRLSSRLDRCDHFIILRSKQAQRPHVAMANDPFRVNHENRTGNFAGNQGSSAVRISHLPSLIREQA